MSPPFYSSVILAVTLTEHQPCAIGSLESARNLFNHNGCSVYLKLSVLSQYMAQIV